MKQLKRLLEKKILRKRKFLKRVDAQAALVK